MASEGYEAADEDGPSKHFCTILPYPDCNCVWCTDKEQGGRRCPDADGWLDGLFTLRDLAWPGGVIRGFRYEYEYNGI